MRRPAYRINNRGLTLVELMVVLVIFALAMAGIYTAQMTTQRSAYTQEEIVDMQQNLRVSLESISRDLRWAGFLIRDTDTPIGAAATANIAINTLSGSRKVAQVATDFTSPATATTAKDITLKEPIDLEADDRVRIVRPGTAAQPVPVILTLNAASSSTALQLTGFTAAHAFSEGDIVAEYINSATPVADLTPNTVTYSLAGTDLVRNNGMGNQVVASNIKTLNFSYLLDDGTEPADPATIADLADIRAVRISLEAEAPTATGTKNRRITSVVALRNR